MEDMSSNKNLEKNMRIKKDILAVNTQPGLRYTQSRANLMEINVNQ